MLRVALQLLANRSAAGRQAPSDWTRVKSSKPPAASQASGERTRRNLNRFNAVPKMPGRGVLGYTEMSSPSLDNLAVRSPKWQIECGGAR